MQSGENYWKKKKKLGGREGKAGVGKSWLQKIQPPRGNKTIVMGGLNSAPPSPRRGVRQQGRDSKSKVKKKNTLRGKDSRHNFRRPCNGNSHARCVTAFVRRRLSERRRGNLSPSLRAGIGEDSVTTQRANYGMLSQRHLAAKRKMVDTILFEQVTGRGDVRKNIFWRGEEEEIGEKTCGSGAALPKKGKSTLEGS